jgi:hypothetical protein
MAITKTKQKQTKENAPKPVTTTKGEIAGFNRATYNYLKKHLKLEETEIFQMSAAICPAKFNGKNANVVLYFDTKAAEDKGLTLKDYESVKEHPELIRYEGYYVHGSGGEINLKKWNGSETSLLQEKIKNSEITDIGAVNLKTGTQKFLSRFLSFLAMGGFLVIILVGVVIAVLISVLVSRC